MPNYKLSNLATQDLDDILDYTWTEFGGAQAEKYSEQLKVHLRLLAENPKLANLRKEFGSPVRIFPSGGHSVVYQEKHDFIYIVRILHQRMNLKEHLS